LDLIFCSQVLEHVSRPDVTLSEFRRALKPGGSLWLSVPFSYAEHAQPEDYFRFTQFGLRHICEDAGLEVGEVEWVEGYLGTLAYQMTEAAVLLPRLLNSATAVDPEVRDLLTQIQSMATTWVPHLAGADLANRETSIGSPINYLVVARKPDVAASDAEH